MPDQNYNTGNGLTPVERTTPQTVRPAIGGEAIDGVFVWSEAWGDFRNASIVDLRELLTIEQRGKLKDELQKDFRKRNEELEVRFRNAMKAIERFRGYEQGGSGQGGPTAWETVNAVEEILAPNRRVTS